MTTDQIIISFNTTGMGMMRKSIRIPDPINGLTDLQIEAAAAAIRTAQPFTNEGITLGTIHTADIINRTRTRIIG